MAQVADSEITQRVEEVAAILVDERITSDSDDSGPDYSAFDIREYDAREKLEYREYVCTYEQDRCNRYLETIARRRKKMILKNIAVFDSLSITKPINTLASQGAEDEPKKVDESNAFSWKSIAPISCAPVTLEAVVPEENTTTKSSNGKADKKHKKDRVKAVVVEETEKDISDEEMMKVLTKRNGTRSPPSNSRTPSNHQSPHSRSNVKENPHRIRVFSTAPTNSPTTPVQKSVQTPAPTSAQTTPSQQPVSNKSRMCNFKNCRRPGCGYAHTMAEFAPVACKFHECKRANCRFFHSGKETKEAYLVRFRNALSSSS